MKKFNLTWGRLAAVLVFALVLYIFFKPPLDEVNAKIIAESAFRSAAKHMKMMPNEFELLRVPTQEGFSKYQYVLFVWQNKNNPNCKIEVDVDLYYADARPTFKSCD